MAKKRRKPTDLNKLAEIVPVNRSRFLDTS